jgi:oxaloacetate decarboxylase alpha subunit
VNAQLQQRVLDGGEPITCRPADLLQAELDSLSAELQTLAQEKSIALTSGEGEIDDVLTYALFPQVGLKFLENRGNPDAFEPAPWLEQSPPPATSTPVPPSPAPGPEIYTVKVNGQAYVVEVSEGGEVSTITEASAAAPPAAAPGPAAGEILAAPLAGNIFKVNVAVGEAVTAGDVVLLLEAMKMETEVRAPRDGTVSEVHVAPGDAVAVGSALITLV